MDSDIPRPPARDRRRAPRVEVLGQLHGAIVALRVPITVRDAGPGGFSIETAIPFPDRAEHQFRFTTDQGLEAILTATSVYCLRTSPEDAAPAYLTGFEFARTDAAGRKQIAEIVETLAGALAAD